MPALVRLVVTFLTALVDFPAAILVRVSDDADEIWDPFLRDVATDPAVDLLR